MKSFAARFCWPSAVLVVLISLQSAAQMGRSREQGTMADPFYNTASEVTVSGTVDDIQQMMGAGSASQTWSCPRGWTGTHLMLKTDVGILPVHVGPSAYLAAKNFTVAKGDKLTILGSKVQYQRSDVLVAKRITKGSQVLTLRNSAGFPMWTGFRLGSTPLPIRPKGY